MSEEKRRVLEMVESGTLTPQDAQRLLEALGERENENREQDGREAEAAAPAKAGLAAEAENTPRAAAGPEKETPAKSGAPAAGPGAPAGLFEGPVPTLELPKDILAEAAGAQEPKEQAPSGEEPAGEGWKQPGGAGPQAGWPPFESCPPPAPGFERYEYTVDTAGVENLEISWVSGPVEVRAWDGDRVRITEYARAPLAEGRRLQLQMTGGTVTVRWAQELVVFGVWLYSKHLIVELPRALAAGLGRIKCANVSGKTYLSGLCAQAVDVSSTSGLVTLGGVTARSLSAKSISGAVRVQDFAAQTAQFITTSGAVEAWGSAEELQLKSISGGLRLTLGQCPGKAALATTSGGIALTLPDEMGFTAKFSSVSGRFSSEFQVEGELGGKQGRAVHGDGYAKLKLNTISGNMKLLKA